MTQFNADILLSCYRQGLFPMAESREDPEVFLVDPPLRGILPLRALHISRSMRRFMRKTSLTFSADQDFTRVMRECARPAPGREDSWINEGIIYLYSQLHAMGHAHSIEVWDEAELVGGLYGVSIGSAFFGESMFSRRANASKAALIKLAERLNRGGYSLLDTQFITPHLATLGAIEIPRKDYLKRLDKALEKNASFHLPPEEATQIWPP